MKVTIEIGPDVEVTVNETKDGRVLSIEFEPTFNRKQGNSVLCYGEVVNAKGVTLDRFSLTVSGSSGKTSRVGRLTGVCPAADGLDSPVMDPSDSPEAVE
jgi:hypothetical protein